MASDPNTIASLIERMEQSGWITRKQHERDKRAHRIRISENGKQQYFAIREIALKLQSEVFDQIPTGRRENFLEDLAEVAASCNHAALNSPKKGTRYLKKKEVSELLGPPELEVPQLDTPSPRG